jgi:hypothetical protein
LGILEKTGYGSVGVKVEGRTGSIAVSALEGETVLEKEGSRPVGGSGVILGVVVGVRVFEIRGGSISGSGSVVVMFEDGTMSIPVSSIEGETVIAIEGSKPVGGTVEILGVVVGV